MNLPFPPQSNNLEYALRVASSGVQVERPANGNGPPEEFACEHLFHDRYPWRRDSIAVIELASRQQSRPHRLEIPWSGSVEKGLLTAARCPPSARTHCFIPTPAPHCSESALAHGDHTRPHLQPNRHPPIQ